MATAPQTDCVICRQQRGEELAPGGPIYETDLVWVSHAYDAAQNPEPYLGHLLVEPKRHALGFAELEDDEAAAIGVAIARVSRVLEQVEGAEHVYVVVVGHHTPHLHVHLVPRYPGTPREHWDPLRLDEWPDAKRGAADEAAAVAARLRAALSG